MNQSESQIDPIVLQRLIDGELDQEQVRLMLTKAQTSPEHWKQIAVGFVEDQSFQQAFDASFSTESNLVFGTHNLQNEPLNERESDEHQPDSVDIESVVAKASREVPQHKPSPKWIMAASLLAAAAIGYMVSQIQSRTIPNNSIVENTTPTSPTDPIAKNSNDPPDQIRPVSLSPDYHVELPEKFVGFNNEAGSRVPIFRVGNEKQFQQFRQQRQDASRIPDEILVRLSESGFQMQTEIEIISGSVGDGEEFVVPVRTIRFVPFQ